VVVVNTLGVASSILFHWPLHDNCAYLGAIGFGIWCAVSVTDSQGVESAYYVGAASSKGHGCTVSTA